ncbi:MAG: hypothetical protein IH953_02770 [Chloroflexi bacterium]|nr:hypothetical protein [Chloroflexota bacterium]
MNQTEIRQRTALSWALDPSMFLAEVSGMTLDGWQIDALNYSGLRLAMNCSRQSGKSTIAAARGFHSALFMPRSLILLVSPSLRQSGELFRKCRDLLDWLPRWLRPSLIEDNRLSIQFENQSRIVSLPGTETKIRGFSGASAVIVDEASRVLDELIFALRPMLSVSGGELILGSTPFGKRGYFHKIMTADDDIWKRVTVTANECPRISDEFLAEERAEMPDQFYQQEYFCAFSDRSSQIFSWEEIQAAVTDEVLPLFSQVAGVESSAVEADALYPLFSQPNDGGEDE